MARQIIGLREPTTIILLNAHNIKPTPNDLPLYSYINVALNPHARSFYLQQMVTKRDSQLAMVQRISLEYSTLNETSMLHLLLPKLGDH